eukprot:72004-Pleurochrysis_carterae.AAC.1
MWDIPRDPIGFIRSAAMFYVVPVATNVKTMIYMGLRAILGCSTGNSCLCNSVGVSPLSARWSIHEEFGYTLMCKWGHPAATLPSEEGDYTSLSQNDMNSANHAAASLITTMTTSPTKRMRLLSLKRLICCASYRQKRFVRVE